MDFRYSTIKKYVKLRFIRDMGKRGDGITDEKKKILGCIWDVFLPEFGDACRMREKRGGGRGILLEF